jgi:ribulose-phosphate 3-epimerase
MIEVLPAIIPHTKEQIEEEIRKVAKFAKVIQIDVSDGIFVPTKTWPYNGRDADYFEKLKTEEEGWPRWEDVEFEIHLMVKYPEHIVLDWIKTGAGAIIAHVESTDNFQNIIDTCREHAVSLGVAIKPSTDIKDLEAIVPQVDFIQVMGSDMLGKHGVELDDKAVEKIKSLRELYPERIIAIDIGVSLDTKERLIEAGATKLISGGAILDSESPEEIYNDLSK